MIVSMKPKLKMFLFLVLPVGTAYSQECKVLERESYSKPLFSLSRFSKECSEQKRMASAHGILLWNKKTKERCLYKIIRWRPYLKWCRILIPCTIAVNGNTASRRAISR